MSIDRQKVIDTAQKYAAKGQFDKAIVEYMRAVKEDPTDVRVLLKIGDLQVRKGAKDDAIATYSRVASGYDQQGFFLKAIAVYKQILSIDPNLTDLYARLADLYVKLGLVPDALAHLDALASRYARAGQDDKVVTVLRQMTQVDAANVPTRIKLAELLSKLGKSEDAASEFEAGGNLLKDAGRVDDWAKVSERLLFHRPNDAALAKGLAAHYLHRQDAKRALPKLQVCFKANPKDVETLELLANAFRELGQIPKTISVFKEIARIHQDAGQQEKRNEMYRRVLELAPNDVDAKDALKGSSRMGRRPSAPPSGNETTGARKPSSPSMPAARAPSGEMTAAKRTSSPSLPAATQSAAPPADIAPDVIEEEVVEEIVVEEDADQDAVYDLQPSAAKSIRPPAADPVPTPARAAASVAPRRAPSEPKRPAVQPPRPTDPAADLARMLGEADIFIKYGLKQKAAGHLEAALAIDPNSIDVLTRLRDLHTDLGDAQTASRASAHIAEIIASSDAAAALAEASHAVQLDPANAAALEIYERLGGSVGAYGSDHASGEYADDFAQAGPGYEAAVAHPPDAFPSDEFSAPSTDSASLPAGGEATAGRDIEEGLDEAEFFVTQGLYDEARDSLSQLLEAHPGHPLVIERFEELEALVQAQSSPAEDQTFALAEKLAEEVSNVADEGGAQFNAGGEMIDVETVFAQFKKGVERTVGAEDADTHYDLGIAYKEMGLTDDAVSEFKIAAQSSRKMCLAETMIGLCYMERGDVATAIEHLKRALQAPAKSEREDMALYFELGNAYETVGDLSEAMYFFQKVEKRDPNFRGVRQRVQRLSAHVTSGTRQQPAQTAEMDEVDRAFDELLKG